MNETLEQAIRYHLQERPFTCGAACLRMLLSPYADFSEEILARLSGTVRWGTTPLNLARAARQLGYETDVVRQANMDEIKRRLPCVVILNAGLLIGQSPTRWGHYVVVKEVRDEEVIINDPAPGYGGENVAID